MAFQIVKDLWGRIIKPAVKPEMQTVAAAALSDRWSSYPSAGLTPGGLNQIFRGADYGDMTAQMELFEDMEEKDAHLAAVLQTRKMAVAGLEWLVEPYEETPQGQEVAQFVDDCLRAVNLDTAIFNLLDAVGKGYAAGEILWQISGRQVVVEAIEWVNPKKLTFAASFSPMVLTTTGRLTGIEPPLWKLIFHRNLSRSGDVTRGGLLRVCAWYYLFKNYTLKDWIVFNEVFGMPLRLGKYDTSASQADRDNLVAALKSLGTDAAGIISKSTEIEFVEASSRLSGTSNPYQLLADFCNREMSKAVLGQTLTTDTSGGTGTYSAGKVHNEVRKDLVVADAEALATTLREQLIRPLVGFNFGWDKPLPYFRFNLAEEEDLKTVSETYVNVQNMGFPMTLEHISDRFGVPLPEDGQTLMRGQKAEGGEAEGSRQKAEGRKQEKEEEVSPAEEDIDDAEEAVGSRQKAEGSRQRAEGREILPLRDGGAMEITPHDLPVIRAQQELKTLTQAAMQASADVVARMLAPVRARIEAGESLEQIRDGLLDAYPEMAAAELGELVYQASMLAYMKGRERGN